MSFIKSRTPKQYKLDTNRIIKRWMFDLGEHDHFQTRMPKQTQIQILNRILNRISASLNYSMCIQFNQVFV